MIDISGWEGISFWARRGPDSQAGFRALVGDKYTDDDIAYIMYHDDPTQPRYCERVRECGCLNHKSCVAVHLDRASRRYGYDPEQAHSGWLPAGPDPPRRHAGHEVLRHARGDARRRSSNGASACNTCVETKCDERWPAFPDDCGERGGNCLTIPVPSEPTPSTTASRARRTRCATASSATGASIRRGRAAGGADRAVRGPLDARPEPQDRMAVLHGAVQRDGAAGLGQAFAGSISRRCPSSASPGTAAGRLRIDDVRFYKTKPQPQ